MLEMVLKVMKYVFLHLTATTSVINFVEIQDKISLIKIELIIAVIKRICPTVQCYKNRAQLNNFDVTQTEMHSQLDGPCPESSPWWPEHHSAGWLPPCICSDPWQTEANRVRQNNTNTDGQNNRQAHKEKKHKVCQQFQLTAHYFQVTRSE